MNPPRLTPEDERWLLEDPEIVRRLEERAAQRVMEFAVHHPETVWYTIALMKLTNWRNYLDYLTQPKEVPDVATEDPCSN